MRAFARAHKWTPPWYEQERAELLERLFWRTRSDARRGPDERRKRSLLVAHLFPLVARHRDRAALVWRRSGHALPDEVAGAGEALSAFRQARGV